MAAKKSHPKALKDLLAAVKAEATTAYNCGFHYGSSGYTYEAGLHQYQITGFPGVKHLAWETKKGHFALGYNHGHAKRKAETPKFVVIMISSHPSTCSMPGTSYSFFEAKEHAEAFVKMRKSERSISIVKIEIKPFAEEYRKFIHIKG